MQWRAFWYADDVLYTDFVSPCTLLPELQRSKDTRVDPTQFNVDATFMFRNNAADPKKCSLGPRNSELTLISAPTPRGKIPQSNSCYSLQKYLHWRYFFSLGWTNPWFSKGMCWCTQPLCDPLWLSLKKINCGCNTKKFSYDLIQAKPVSVKIPPLPPATDIIVSADKESFPGSGDKKGLEENLGIIRTRVLPTSKSFAGAVLTSEVEMAERTTTETIILTKKYIADMGLSLALS